MLTYKSADNGPQYREHPRSSHDQHPAHGLRVVGLDNLYDPQQRPHPGPPQVPHVEPVQVDEEAPGRDRSLRRAGRFFEEFETFFAYMKGLEGGKSKGVFYKDSCDALY